MTTEQATAVLAEWLNAGVSDIASMTTCSEVNGLMGAAVEQGRAWNWGAAEKHIHNAYRVLGAQPVGTGYDWHKGCHPIQILAEQWSKI